MRPHRTAAVLVAGLTAAAAATTLAGCDGDPGPGAGSTTNPPTVTVTVTKTLPGPTLTSPTAPSTLPTTPPPADSQPIPGNARDYSGAFVTAWAKRDRARAGQLATASVVKAAFASNVPTAPHLKGCEGAAGSSYCTYEGDEYTMTVRVLNELAAQRQPHAVTEVRFGH